MKNKKNNLIIKPIHNPYQCKENNSIGIIYSKYINDKNRLMIKDNRTFYKVLQSFLFQIKTTDILALVDKKMNLHINDILIDENNNTYKVKAFEMINFNCTDFPEWYTKITPVLLSGNPNTMGEFLALYKTQY